MNTYTTAVLIGLVRSLVQSAFGSGNKQTLLGKYFPTVRLFDTEEVHVDVEPISREVAPLVSPLVEGKVMEHLGQRTNIIKPAYVKPKMRFAPPNFMSRAPGEAIGGELSPQQRMDLYLSQSLTRLLGAVGRRKELMASEALRLGKVTLSGEKYPTTVVDYGRDAALTIANPTGTNVWGNTAAKPLNQLQTAATLGLQTEGASLVDVIMGVDAWTEFKDNPQIEKRLLQLNAAGTSIDRVVQSSEGLQYKGTIDNLNIYVYAGWYKDPETGTVYEIWPAKSVVVTADVIDGLQLHGAILDPKAGMQALEAFPKMWDEEDPAARWLMLQSAPLVVPQRPNASVYIADVLTG